MLLNILVDICLGILDSGVVEFGEELVFIVFGEGNIGSVVIEYLVFIYWQDDFDGDGSVENFLVMVIFGVYWGYDWVIYWQEC